jgi:RNA polymerase sigma-70 factor (ECF subfamily)
MERSMRATLRRNSQAVATPRALERQALHEFDDGRLVLEHLAGDPQAFGTLVDRYQTRLLNFINRTIGDRERAEDLVQEVFIRVFRHLHRFDQTKKFSTWIYTIASNLAKNELRNRSRNPLVLFQTIKKHWEADHRPLQFEDTTARPDDLYRKRFLKEAVDQCVDQLPTHHRAVFVLRELEGKSYAEIADTQPPPPPAPARGGAFLGGVREPRPGRTVVDSRHDVRRIPRTLYGLS